MAASLVKSYPGRAPLVSGPAIEVPNPKFTAFSRASHFAMLLVPALIALSWVIARDGDLSFLIQLREIGALLFGVGSALTLLYGMDQVADRKL